MCLSIYLSIYPCIFLSIYLAIYIFIYILNFYLIISFSMKIYLIKKFVFTYMKTIHSIMSKSSFNWMAYKWNIPLKLGWFLGVPLWRNGNHHHVPIENGHFSSGITKGLSHWSLEPMMDGFSKFIHGTSHENRCINLEKPSRMGTNLWWVLNEKPYYGYIE